jgi:GntR family transcriptional regulator
MPASPSSSSSDKYTQSQPLWARIALALRGRVLAGEWKAGEAIPAESALSEFYGVALGTMRGAIQSLVEDGLLERIHGRGTFVRGGLTGATMLRFFRFGSAEGDVPESRIKSVRSVKAPALAARELLLAADEQAICIERQRCWDGKVQLLETLWVPHGPFKALLDVDKKDFSPLMYPMYAERLGITVNRAVDELSVDRLSAAQARTLDLPVGHPALRVERVAFDLAGRRIEFRVTIGNADHFRYRAEIR